VENLDKIKAGNVEEWLEEEDKKMEMPEMLQLIATDVVAIFPLAF